jgi:hypothetical protein
MYRDEIKKSGTAAASSAAVKAEGIPIVRDMSLFAGAGQPYEASRRMQGGIPTAERDDEDIIPTSTGGTGMQTGTIPNRTVGGYSEPAHHHTAPGMQQNPANLAQSHSEAAYNPSWPPSRGFSIERIVVFYKDKTFSEYQPS